MSYETWMKAKAPTYLQDVYGQAWMGGIGATMDDYVQQYIAGVLAAFPDYAPADALGALGDEIGIDRGASETDAAYANRLARAMEVWAFAGSPMGLLRALYGAGYSGGEVVQQNGNGYTLAVTVADGITSYSIVIRTLGLNPAIGGIRPLAAGVTPWWTFDATGLDAANDQFNSRFGVYFASDAGYFGTIAARNRFRAIVAKWKPGKATFMGWFLRTSGKVWGDGHTYNDGTNWGGASTVYGAALE
jgi:hypothetical protein